MGLLSAVVLLPVTGPVRGFRAVLEAIRAEVEAEMVDEEQIQGALLELDIRHDAGQIEDAEYEAEQSRLLEELNQIRAYKEQSMEAPTDTGRSAL
jgi:hypothetical protein